MLARKSVYRRQILIQNVGVNPCLIKVDADPDIDDFDFVLSEDTGAREGNGGNIFLDNCQGEIRALAEGGNTTLAVLEATGGE